MKRIVLLVYILLLALFSSSCLWGFFGSSEAMPETAGPEAGETVLDTQQPPETEPQPPAAGSESASETPGAAPQANGIANTAPAPTAAPKPPAASDAPSEPAASSAPAASEATESQASTPSYENGGAKEDEGELVPLF